MSNIDTPIMLFGKHKGEKIVDVMKNDPKYIEWIMNKSDMNERLKKLIEKLRKPTRHDDDLFD